MSEQDLKCYLVTYTLLQAGSEDTHTIFVIAFDKKEAGDLFIRWAQGKKLYSTIGGIVVQETKKTPQNQHMFTLDYYKKQCDEVNDLFIKGAN